MDRRLLAALGLLAALAGCRELADADAVKLVETYNRRVIDAYRTGDARLVDPVTGPTDGKRITGLIGVKLDQGVTLDSHLDAFSPLRVQRGGDEVVVFTEERWTYRYRRIGSGEQVGPESSDHYVMRYHLRKLEGRWVVDRIAYDRAPAVGRTISLDGDRTSLHGVRTVEPAGGGAEAQPAWQPPGFGGPAR